jgi:hypothetical protein
MISKNWGRLPFLGYDETYEKINRKNGACPYLRRRK